MNVGKLSLVLGCALIFTGCIGRVKPPCAPPGSIQTTSNCYYILELTGLNKTAGEAIGRVPRKIVEENEEDTGKWFGWRFGDGFWRRIVGGIDTYPFFEYQFPVENVNAEQLQELVNSGQPIQFHSVANQRGFLLGPPKDVKTSNPCLDPGQNATQRCFYKLNVKKVDATTGLVTGVVPISVVEQSAKLFPRLVGDLYRQEEYTFPVRDTTSITQGSEQDFVSVPNSNYLEKCAKPNCEEYFPQ